MLPTSSPGMLDLARRIEAGAAAAPPPVTPGRCRLLLFVRLLFLLRQHQHLAISSPRRLLSHAQIRKRCLADSYGSSGQLSGGGGAVGRGQGQPASAALLVGQHAYRAEASAQRGNLSKLKWANGPHRSFFVSFFFAFFFGDGRRRGGECGRAATVAGGRLTGPGRRRARGCCLRGLKSKAPARSGASCSCPAEAPTTGTRHASRPPPHAFPSRARLRQRQFFATSRNEA
ncbi:hypothetical protein BS78_04G045600 [Paspalum vaginatum]|nr:hypothetical protein BS78_04G045600 [Paspalum vaginatum]